MSFWEDQRQRLVAYWGPWYKISQGFQPFFSARPTWLGGRPRPGSITARDYATAQLFLKMGTGFKNYESQNTSVPSLCALAYGVVLEVGPGIGNQIDRFDQTKIEHIYGVESNPGFVPSLLAEVAKAGIEKKYTVILGHVEDEALLSQHGIEANTLDCIVCLQALCSVENPEQTMRGLYRLLKPGGAFIFWEHGRSDDILTRLVQELWNPLWRFFLGGCNLNRSIEQIIRNADEWDLAASDMRIPSDPALKWSCLPRVEGQMIKPRSQFTTL